MSSPDEQSDQTTWAVSDFLLANDVIVGTQLFKLEEQLEPPKSTYSMNWGPIAGWLLMLTDGVRVAVDNVDADIPTLHKLLPWARC